MNPCVMIIDDSLTVRMDLAEAFRESGFEVVLCASATDARTALASKPPALIVLDVVLPDADGVQFLAHLRNLPAMETAPIILLSSEAEVKDRIRGLTCGANEYVGKPYDSAYVVARASELLRGSDASRVRRSPTILVIDDSPTYRTALATTLEQAGYQIALAASAKEGLRRAADLQPDAIIVDGVMPDLDGTAVIRKIRLDPGLNTTPCLLLTASEEAANEVTALDSGADAYARKNEATDVILTRLSAMLRTARDSRHRTSVGSLMGPKRILTVDDSVTYLEEIAEQLRADGYDVIKAQSGEDALALLAVEAVDCILLDRIMPGLSGTETCTRIKSRPDLRNIPLIMLTARDQPDAMIDGMNAGADDYVAKSVEFDVIKARLRAQLRRKQFEDENRRMRENILKKDAEARAAREQSEARAELLQQLEEKNRDLERLNHELEMFAYSVSHDLRQPLRSMDGFSQVLLDDYGDQIDARGKHYLERVRAGAQRMGQLIDGLLMLSRVTRKELAPAAVRLDVIARRVIERLHEAEPLRSVTIAIEEPLDVVADPHLVESVLENLLGNAWKFTGQKTPSCIELGSSSDAGIPTYFVRDNGAGFKMAFADKLFAPFQRFHSDKEFPGTGIGLATTQRIVHRHGGRIWAHSQVGEGATFFFTLSPQLDEC